MLLGWLFSFFEWFFLLSLLGLCGFAVVVAVGDVVLTKLLRQFGSKYFDPQIQIEWSFKEGKFLLKCFQLTASLLEQLSPSLDLPLDLEKMELQTFLIQFSLYDFFVKKTTPLPYFGIKIEGFKIGLNLHASEKWMWNREENLARLQEAVLDAAKARLARGNSLTTMVLSKLAEIESIKKLVETQKKDKEKKSSNDKKKEPTSPPKWQLMIDDLISSFEVLVKRIMITIRNDGSAAGLGISLEKFAIEKAARIEEKGCQLTKRPMKVQEFVIFLNSFEQTHANQPSHIIEPMTIDMNIVMPPVLQGIVMKPAPVEGQELMKVGVNVDISFPTKLGIQFRPVQLQRLLLILKPLEFYGDWTNRASMTDELACTEMTREQVEEYTRLYKEQDALNSKGLVARLIAGVKQKAEIAERTKRLEELEAKVQASRLVTLRWKACGWKVPSGGKVLPYISEELKQKATIRRFLATPVNKYLTELPEAGPAVLDTFTLNFSLGRFQLELLDNEEKSLLVFFTERLAMDLSTSLAPVEDEAPKLELNLTLRRFVLQDPRNLPTNVFSKLLDRNPDSTNVLQTRVSMLGNGHLDVGVACGDFSFLVISDPLLAVSHAFLPALEQDEETELRYLESEMFTVPPSPEQREEATIVFEEELPHAYDPLLLGGMSLHANVELKGWEVCLLGDPSDIKSHVLSLTADTKIVCKSDKTTEKLGIQLWEVALQPCTIELMDDAIDLEIPGLRTILELEGEGVDLELRYQMTVGNEKELKKQLTAAASNADIKAVRSSKSMWNVARSGVLKKEVVEVKHPVLESAEQLSLDKKTDRMKGKAKRKVTMTMSDFGLNLATDDLGVFLSIAKRVTESMEEDEEVIQERQEREARMNAKRKELEETRYIERLRAEFQKLDVDGGGTLDTKEIATLLENVMKGNELTKDEFNATVAEFIKLVDRDATGDVSIEEFLSALDRKKINYHGLHHGTVHLTAQEYIDPSHKRKDVPHVLEDKAKTATNVVALGRFWEKYEKQTGATKNSLKGQTALSVQKKMIRVFRNYEYAQEAWNRLVNPSLAKPGERSPWLVMKEMNVGGRGNVIDVLLSSFNTQTDMPLSLVPTAAAAGMAQDKRHMFIHTVVTTSFGGFYIRLIDHALPMGIPALEFAVEECAIYTNVSMWEGGGALSDGASDVQDRKHAQQNYGVARLSFKVYSKYYNPSARQIEPFMEYYHGFLYAKKDVMSHLDIVFSSDRYLQLNITSAFMGVVQNILSSFSKVTGDKAKKERNHIKEEGGLFWMKNEAGVNFKYYVVAKKEDPKMRGTRREIVSEITSVPPTESHACVLLNLDEEMKDHAQQNMKEKQLRQAFRDADVDGSGELTAEEVRIVLKTFYEQEKSAKLQKQQSFGDAVDESEEPHAHGHMRVREDNTSVALNQMTDEDLSRIVDDFMVLADTDMSGQVSWEEFKAAIAKTRQTVDRYLTIEIEGFEPLENVPLVSLGQTQVYELVPHFEEIENQVAVPLLYREGVLLLNKDDPTQEELAKAYAYLRKVKDLDPTFEWINSYYAECSRMYLPKLVAVTISVDGFLGLQVAVSGGEYLRNDTAKTTQLLLLDECHQPARHNPTQEGYDSERFFVLKPKSSLAIPLDLVDAGYFSIRQEGEEEWSNQLPLTLFDQRRYKNLTHWEQKVARRKSQKRRGATNSSAQLEGSPVPLPDVDDPTLEAGKEVLYPSFQVIDGQPTVVMEKISSNNMKLGTWHLVIQPQLMLSNLLPCGMEYAIVQPKDCPVRTLDANNNFKLVGGTAAGKSSRAVKILNHIDYFDHVDAVNSRRAFVESGKSIQIFGLDLEQPALMKVRLCTSPDAAGPDAIEMSSHSRRGGRLPTTSTARRGSDASMVSYAASAFGVSDGGWSAPFLVYLNSPRDTFNADHFDLRFNNGPSLVFNQQWNLHGSRTLMLYAPYWIHNRTGLDLQLKFSKGSVCTLHQHRQYFSNVTGKEVPPLMANGPASKAILSIKPYQESPRLYDMASINNEERDDDEEEGKYTIKKYLPTFEKMDWSEQRDVSSVGTKGEFKAKDNSFVLSYDIRAAPGQFFRTRIVVLSPRYAFVSRVPRPLQLTPVLLDKKNRFIESKKPQKINTFLKENEALLVYRFVDSDKKSGRASGLRLRDALVDEGLAEMGPWSPSVPMKVGEEYNVWTRGTLGEGPVCNVCITNVEETIYATISDISDRPRYRIENRSTRHAFRYIQNGQVKVQETVLQPLESHTFVWNDPLEENPRLKVTPVAWKILTLVDFMQIGPVANMTPERLHGEVYIDGSTRVLAIGDTEIYQSVRDCALWNDWLSTMVIDVGFHGLGLSIVDVNPREVLNFTMENVHIYSPLNSRQVVLELMHMQIDDMTPNPAYPVVLGPVDTGFNSDKAEGWMPEDGETPFFRLSVETSPQHGIIILNDFEIRLGSLAVRLNVEYLMVLLKVLMQFIPGSEEDVALQQGIDAKDQMLALALHFPQGSERSGYLMYFKRWCLSAFEVDLVFDSAQEESGEGISAILGSTLGSIIGGIAHITPEFKFSEIEYENRFFYEYDLIYSVIMRIVLQVVAQWYKIVGSVELLGDPVGLATDITDGFALAMRQIKRDFKGKSQHKGQGALTLVQTVLGAPLKAVGKASNGLGDVVKKAIDFESQEAEEEPRHVPEGLLQSGVVFGKSIAYGFSGLVTQPVRGAKKEGIKGFAKGVGKGALQFVASPVVGTLGVVEKLSQSVNNTTHLLDEKSFEGTRRPARDLNQSALKSLADSNVITEVELHILSVRGLPENVSSKVYVRLYTKNTDGNIKELNIYKSSTIRNTTEPVFDQSWLVSVHSVDTFIEFSVYQKRKPRPKKLLGRCTFSLEDIYRDFDSVPSRLVADSHAKMILKKRKRFRGSILNELAKMNPLERLDDEIWRHAATTAKTTTTDSSSRRLRTNSSSYVHVVPEDAEEEDANGQDEDEDDYEEDVKSLRKMTFTAIEETYAPFAVSFPLQDGKATNASIQLSIRYVNDMRR